MKLIDYVKFNEGCKLEAYADQFGKPTIGYGHTGADVTLGMSCTQDQATEWLSADLAKAQAGALDVIGREAWLIMNPIRRIVITDMVFQMGPRGVGKFFRTLDFVRKGEWHAAAAAMLQSLWAKQTPNRAARNIAMMLTGLPFVGE